MSNPIYSAIVVNGQYSAPILTAVKVSPFYVPVRTQEGLLRSKGDRFQVNVTDVLVDESMNRSTSVVRLFFTPGRR